jgi:recombination protein RecR
MKLARPVNRLIEALERLPGIGPKTAQRLAFYLLHVPQSELTELAESAENLKKQTVLCSTCKNVSETDPCPVCSDRDRDASQIMVVENPLDVLVLEQTGKFKGTYHVLHGVISPLNNIGPDELYIKDLFDRVLAPNAPVTELIIATDPTMEGEATSLYIEKEVKKHLDGQIKITRLGSGLPVGADLEYVDEVTLTRAYEGRKEITHP